MKIQSAMRAVAIMAVMFWSQMSWAQAKSDAKPEAKPAAAAPAKADPVLEDAVPGVGKDELGSMEDVEKMLRGDLGERSGDAKKFLVRTDDDITAIRVGDLYKNEEAAYKIVAIKKQTAKGGEFTAERIAGQSNPQRRWMLVSAKEKTAPKVIITHLSLLDLYLQGGPFLHPIAALFVVMVVLSVNGMLIFRRKAQCDPAFVDSAEAALVKGDIRQFDELGRNSTGLMPFICRHMTRDFDSSTMAEIRSQVSVATAAQISRLRIPVRALNLISVAAPLLGLLGTIVGMVLVFEGVAGTSGAAKASILAAGIRVKLFSTATALMVAIPSLFIYFVFNQQLGVIIDECDIIHERFMVLLARIKRERGQDVGAEEAPTGKINRE